MKKTTIQFLRLLLSTIIFWTIALSLFIVIRYYAIGEEEGHFKNEIPIIHWLIYIGVPAGIIVGLFYAVVEFLFDKFISKHLSIGLVIIEKSLVYLIALVLSVTYISRLIENIGDIDLPNDTIGWWKTQKVFWIILGYFIFSSFIFSFIKIANEKFGKGVFFNLLIGKYKKPREEKRVFMFLDLKGSTSIAEQLGHYKYSELIQECFYDLNRVVGNYNAEIYQYVGDEAVLSWRYDKGVKNNNCVDLFYRFQNSLSKKESTYKKRFGLLPNFKAGIHGGKLIVTEVGTVKKEIAFHGDVINTSARIQGECNKYNETLLISEYLLENLNLNENFKTECIGDISLKGKQEQLKLFSINKS